MTAYRNPARSRDVPAMLDSSLLSRFVLLSMLLHVLVLLVFGTAPGTPGARRGDGAWGGLDVTLRRLSPESGSEIKLAPGEETTAPGTAILRRLGGAAAPTTPEKSSTTILPQQPAASAVEPPAPSAAPAEMSPPPVASPPSELIPPPPESVPPTQPSSFEALTPLNRSAPEVVDRPFAPAVTVPVPKVETPAPAPPEPKLNENPTLPSAPVAPPIERRGETPMREAPTREAPTAPTPQRIERAIPPKIEAPPVVEPSAREIPVVPAPPPIEPVVPREIPAPSAPKVIEPVAPPRLEREIAPVVEPAREKSVAPPAPSPVERAAPPKVERDAAPAIEAPRERPAPMPSQVERVAPKIEPEMAPPIEPPASRRAPLESSLPRERAAPQMERPTPPAAVPARPLTPSAPARTDTPAGEAPRLRFGAPDAGDEIFKPRGNAEQNAPPRLDLEATRQRAREIASDGSAYRGVAPVIPAPAPVERKSKLAEGIDKAQKPDCRNAYADMGLLAVVPLVASTVADGNGGCRW